MSIEDKIRDLATRGEITHLSLVPRGKGWECSYAPAGVPGISYAHDDDPVHAIEQALDGIKLKRRAVKGSEPHDSPAPRKRKTAATFVCVTCNGEGFINRHANLPDEPCPDCYGKPDIAVSATDTELDDILS